VFGYEKYEETGRAVESEERETRARDDHIKNLPTHYERALLRG
jgi:hypothetical protein